MKYLDEYRDARAVEALAAAIRRTARRRWTIMEVCGGQTHAILRFGIDRLLPETVELIHGPGCPVCVTPPEAIDRAIAIARAPRAILASFGDMLRVPGSAGSLLDARAAGGDVRMVYSPLDALELARRNPSREVVFFAVGFETTAPATALAAKTALAEGIGNFSLLVAHVLVPPAIEAILSSEANRVQGFLAAGHVCTVMGFEEYEPLARRHRVPIVVTGFEPVDILEGVLLCVRQLEEGRAEVENQYLRAVRRRGNEAARALLAEVFQVVPRRWRGIGEIAASGLGLSPAYAALDAEARFAPAARPPADDARCIAGLVLKGARRPPACPSFGSACTPEHPLGAPMVSSEGACAAYYRYRRQPASAAEES
ncbi:MAG: hydrogenase formation protein HypD [Burkholderiales bacterium]|nr:hydrogenase formation protein HypD [Burkholderiales bacterium]